MAAAKISVCGVLRLCKMASHAVVPVCPEITSSGLGNTQRHLYTSVLARTSSMHYSSGRGSSPPTRHYAGLPQSLSTDFSSLQRLGRGVAGGLWSTDDHGQIPRETVSVTASMLEDMFGGIFKGADLGESTRQEHTANVNLVNLLDAEMCQLSDAELREVASRLQKRAQAGESLDSLLPEAVAVVREGSKRVLGPPPSDVQLDELRASEPPLRKKEAAHVPVLLKEVVSQFESRRLTSFVDCTLGAGGHSVAVVCTAQIISAHPEMEIFLGMDVDPVAHAEAYPMLQRAAADSRAYSDSNSDLNLHVKCSNFRNIKNVLKDLDPMLTTGGVDGILMDLGMSSMQVNEAERGFSFMRDGPADMRMDPTASLTAEVILNTWPESEIGRILREYGEERRWKYLAQRIVEERLSGGISTTSHLVEVIGGSSYLRTKGKHGRLKPTLHPATRTFQALRIAVNDELKSLQLALSDAYSCLSSGGRLQVITFHSLEDRIVKHFFLEVAGLYKSSYDLGENEADQSILQEYSHIPGETRHSKYIRKQSLHDESGGNLGRRKNMREGRSAKILTRRPIIPSDEEIALNPRSRSAKLRVIEKK